MQQLTDPALAAVAEKVHAGGRLDKADGLATLATRDIHALGDLADEVRRRRHGEVVYYNVNRHINYTNHCVAGCTFCSFYRREGADGLYELSAEQMAEIARGAAEGGATELHITGGLHPSWRIDHYEGMLRAVGAAAPRLHLKAFTAVEIAHVATLSDLSAERVLQRLIDVGLGSLPGGGAEVFSERLHRETFPGKIGPAEWLDIHRTAHRLGLPTNATMLYGHVETHAERIDHLLALRRLADETGGFQCVVPLSFIPADTALAHEHHLTGTTGLDDLRTLATARLMLDNIPHVKSFWVMHGIKLAQVSLDWGVDDIDGTVVSYDITKPRPGATGQEMTVPHLRRLIAETGRTPTERDSLYRPITRTGNTWRVQA